MNEIQRLTYLAHLGIDHYIARRPLKGAAPSVERPVALDTSLPESTSPTPAETATNKKSTADSTPDLPLRSQPESIHFALNFWHIDDDLLVLDSREPGAALPTGTLLLNIVRSIGYPLEQLPQADLLRWPLFNRDQNANNEDEARAMVQAYIQAQVSKQSAKHLFLMGADATKFTLNKFDDWQLVEGKTFQQWQMTLTVIPSLTDMLREPLLKCITWRAIKPLYQNPYVTNT